MVKPETFEKKFAEGFFCKNSDKLKKRFFVAHYCKLYRYWNQGCRIGIGQILAKKYGTIKILQLTLKY